MWSVPKCSVGEGWLKGEMEYVVSDLLSLIHFCVCEDQSMLKCTPKWLPF